MIVRRLLVSLVIACVVAIPAQGSFAASAQGNNFGQPAVATSLTRLAGSSNSARWPVSLMERIEVSHLVSDRMDASPKDPRTPMVCRTRRC
jgi:hypothetical protein